MKKLFAISAMVTLSAIACLPTAAQTTVGPLNIQSIVAGWGSDSFSLNIGGAIPNPAGCPSPDIVGISDTDGGYKTLYAAALTAWSNNTPVVVVISNTTCSGARPKLIGLNLQH